jgi:hypothetical protein
MIFILPFVYDTEYCRETRSDDVIVPFCGFPRGGAERKGGSPAVYLCYFVYLCDLSH